ASAGPSRVPSFALDCQNGLKTIRKKRTSKPIVPTTASSVGRAGLSIGSRSSGGVALAASRAFVVRHAHRGHDHDDTDQHTDRNPYPAGPPPAALEAHPHARGHDHHERWVED